MEEALNSHLTAERLKYLLNYDHLIIVRGHPQGNSMEERRMKEVGTHLRTLVYEYRVRVESLSTFSSTNTHLHRGWFIRD